jgi:cation diffusion facilitator family transporter
MAAASASPAPGARAPGGPARNPVEAKKRVALLSVASNTCLVLLKLAVGVAIGSVAILSEAIHSGIDLIAAGIAYLSVRKSGEPADDCHTFGHGKYEDISGFIEAVLIFIAAILIIREAGQTLLSGGETLDVEVLPLGIAVMAVSAIANAIVSSRLMKVARETESIALESDAWHLRTDVYTSVGVLAGLVAIRLTGMAFLDAVVAIAIAGVIMRAAFDLTRRSFADLVDHSLPREEELRIRSIIADHCTDYADFHDLRTRRSGPDRYIDFHLCVARHLTVEQAHDLTDHLEADLGLEFPRSHISIHIEPCNEDCEECGTCRQGDDNRPATGGPAVRL